MNWLQAQDEGASYAMIPIQWTWLITVLKAVTFLGEQSALIVAALVAIALFLILRRWRTALLFTVMLLAANLFSDGVKSLVNRQRPELSYRAIDKPNSPSFPSGHALLGMVVYGGIALSLAAVIRQRIAARLVILVGFGMAVLIGFSRMYLGVHFMSDVAGGFCAGLAFVLLFRWVDQQWSARVIPETPAAAVIASRVPMATAQASAEHIQSDGPIQP
jgi:undecaprenyl-diphosphatase